MKSTLTLAFVLLLGTTLWLSCQQAAVSPSGDKSISHDSLVSRGHYLVSIIGCGDCHSPKKFGPHGPEEDTSRALSGYPSDMPLASFDSTTTKNWVLFNGTLNASVGPWGVSFAANLTSDPAGIGDWTEERFIIALKEGRSKGLRENRMLLPPMPWQDFSNLTVEDMKAIFAYLKSTKPIHNFVPAPIPPDQLGKIGYASKK